MSWQMYVDEHLICDNEGQRLTAAVITGHDGSVWAQNSLFPQFKPNEISVIMNDFNEPGSLAPAGLHLGDTKYMIIQGEAGAVIRGKKIVKNWVKQLIYQRGYDTRIVEQAKAIIFIIGSKRLGVNGPGADVDTLSFGPSYVNREEDFFIILHDILAEREEVSELQPILNAHVPVMKFKFNRISVDLLYASISVLGVPKIEWDTYEMLQCHPYPIEYIDSSR